MKIHILIIFSLMSGVLSQGQKLASADAKFLTPDVQERKITYKIIGAPDKTFCYDIFVDGKLLIHQPSIPGLAGKLGFALKSDAEKVASLVIRKLEHGIMPPTIEPRELDSLQIKFRTYK